MCKEFYYLSGTATALCMSINCDIEERHINTDLEKCAIGQKDTWEKLRDVELGGSGGLSCP